MMFGGAGRVPHMPGDRAGGRPSTFRTGAGRPGCQRAAAGLHMDDLLSGIFGGTFGGGAAKDCGKSAPQRPPRPSSFPCAMPSGTQVTVRGLEKAAHHNGKCGVVAGFDELKMRYTVSLDEGSSLSLRPQNLTQKCEIEVFGLTAKPELNGKVGSITSYDDQTGRYMVLLQQPPAALGLQRGNCVLCLGTRVVLEGLANERFNGQMAEIMSVDRTAGRYTVRCQGGDEIKVKLDKVVC
jgi:hypothetical protein